MKHIFEYLFSKKSDLDKIKPKPQKLKQIYLYDVDSDFIAAWDNIGPGPTSDEEEFDYIFLEIGHNEIYVNLPKYWNNHSTGMIIFGFTTDKDPKTGLEEKNIKPIKQPGNSKYPHFAKEILEFIAYISREGFFNKYM